MGNVEFDSILGSYSTGIDFFPHGPTWHVLTTGDSTGLFMLYVQIKKTESSSFNSSQEP
jgi:hypothetical protein